MRHSLRRFPFAFLITAGLMAGCGSPQNEATTGNGSAPGGASTQSVRLLSMDYDPVSSALQKKIVEEFNAQNGGKVEIDIVNWNDGHQKLQTLISGNQAPDLAIVGTRWMAEYDKAGLLADLGKAAKNGVKTSEFVPGVLKAGRINNKLVGLPVAASVRGLYYNSAMLKKAGVTPPKTWAELEAAAVKIGATHPGVAGFGVQGKEVETDLYFYYFLWGAGGDILGANGKSSLASPAGVQALEFELGLVKKKLAQPQPTGYNREDLQELFKAKKVAMIITGPWFAGMLKKQMPDLDFGVTFIPGKSTSVVPAVADEIVMFKSSKNQELAWKFLEFWYRDANRIAWAKASGMIPEKTTIAKNAEWMKDKHRAFFIAALPKGRYVPTHPNWEQMANAVSNGVQQAMLGQMDSKTALQTASTKVDALAK